MVILLRAHIRAIVAAAVLSSLPMARAQTVYRCAQLYSDRPCPGAVAIGASDTRTPQQKAQSDGATQDMARAADRMERERRAVEREQVRSAAARPPFPAASTARSAGGTAAGKTVPARSLQRANELPFTAVARVPPPAKHPRARPSAAAPTGD
jgi:hypothetical protein